MVGAEGRNCRRLALDPDYDTTRPRLSSAERISPTLVSFLDSRDVVGELNDDASGIRVESVRVAL
jgi:hypothetical protein